MLLVSCWTKFCKVQLYEDVAIHNDMAVGVHDAMRVHCRRRGFSSSRHHRSPLCRRRFAGKSAEQWDHCGDESRHSSSQQCLASALRVTKMPRNAFFLVHIALASKTSVVCCRASRAGAHENTSRAQGKFQLIKNCAC